MGAARPEQHRLWYTHKPQLNPATGKRWIREPRVFCDKSQIMRKGSPGRTLDKRERDIGREGRLMGQLEERVREGPASSSSTFSFFLHFLFIPAFVLARGKYRSRSWSPLPPPRRRRARKHTWHYLRVGRFVFAFPRCFYSFPYF